MAQATSAAGLSVEQALQDGWQVFRRGPWPFVGLVLLSLGCNLVAGWLPALANWLIGIPIELWVSIGLMRGVWLGLDRKQPTFDDLIRINRRAMWRLFSCEVVLGVLLAAISGGIFALALMTAEAIPLALELINLSVAMVMGQAEPEALAALLPTIKELALQVLSSPLAILLLVLNLLFNLYVQVSQAFLGYLAVLKGLNPIRAMRIGFATVQRQWWSVLGLLLLQQLIILVGSLCCVGLLAALPVVSGMSASAYRQLFDDEDSVDFLNGR